MAVFPIAVGALFSVSLQKLPAHVRLKSYRVVAVELEAGFMHYLQCIPMLMMAL